MYSTVCIFKHLFFSFKLDTGWRFYWYFQTPFLLVRKIMLRYQTTDRRICTQEKFLASFVIRFSFYSHIGMNSVWNAELALDTFPSCVVWSIHHSAAHYNFINTFRHLLMIYVTEKVVILRHIFRSIYQYAAFFNTFLHLLIYAGAKEEFWTRVNTLQIQ